MKQNQNPPSPNKHWSKLRIILLFITSMRREDTNKDKDKNKEDLGDQETQVMKRSVVGLRNSFLGE